MSDGVYCFQLGQTLIFIVICKERETVRTYATTLDKGMADNKWGVHFDTNLGSSVSAMGEIMRKGKAASRVSGSTSSGEWAVFP